MVFFTGLPATGKSFLLRQQCLSAKEAGRSVHLLRWDSSLSAFLTKDNLAKYPEIGGTSNPIIRHAANLWGRQAVARWHTTVREPDALLIGEVPILGNRFSELVQARSDDIETLLASETVEFLFPIPSNRLRERLEAIRRASFASPRHPDEAKDAPPSTMEWAWRITRSKAIELGLVGASDTRSDAGYDSATNKRFFEYLLQHRNAQALLVDEIFPSESSAHDLDGNIVELIATPSEAAEAIALAKEAMNVGKINQNLDNWYLV